MKKVLILGGSHRDIPLIKASQNLGYMVVTLGNGKNYLGHNYADRFYEINFNNEKKVLKIIEKEKIDCIIPGCGEESYLKSVKLVEKLKIGSLDSYKVASIIHNKWKFKALCLSLGVCTPKGYLYKKEFQREKLEFPIVVKPTNLSGGRGVDIAYDNQSLHDAIKNAQNESGEIFLEEFIKGELIAYSTFIKDQKVIYGFFGKDDTHLNPYLITHAYPIVLEKKIINRLNSDIKKIAKELSLVDGMFHLQVIIKDNLPYIIDVTRRIPGDFYPFLIEQCDKVDYSKAVVKSYIGENLEDEFNQKDKKEFILRYVVMAKTNGVFQGLFIDGFLRNKIVFRFDILKKLEEITDYLHAQISIFLIKIEENEKNIVDQIDKLIYPKINKRK